MKQITLPWPAEPLRSNTRAHWAKKARYVADARSEARLACLAKPRIAPVPTARIFIEYYPPHLRFDQNGVASSLKAYIDGIADAMGCDDKLFVVDYPTQWAGSGKPGKVVFRIEQPC